MSADPKDLFYAVGQLTADALRPFPGSRKKRKNFVDIAARSTRNARRIIWGRH